MRAHPFYDRLGQPIAMQRWSELRDDYDYCVVRKTEVAPAVTVLTIWVGVDDTREQLYPPKIFYSKTRAGYRTSDARRFATEGEAIVGHTLEVDRLLGLLAERITWKPTDPKFNLQVICSGCTRKLRAGDCRTTVVGGEAFPRVLFACSAACETSVGWPELIP